MEARTRRLVHRVVIGVGLLPFIALAVGGLLGRLGANPVEQITHVTGEWALRWLLVSLAITPLRRWFGWGALAPYRRSFGLLAFSYATAHVATYFTLDLALDFGFLVEDVIERPYITVGFAAFSLMVPLALTSTRAMQRRLGRRWRTLHRLAYVVAILAVIHFLWLVKADLGPPAVHAAILALLLALRVWHREPAS